MHNSKRNSNNINTFIHINTHIHTHQIFQKNHQKTEHILFYFFNFWVEYLPNGHGILINPFSSLLGVHWNKPRWSFKSHTWPTILCILLVIVLISSPNWSLIASLLHHEPFKSLTPAATATCPHFQNNQQPTKIFPEISPEGEGKWGFLGGKPGMQMRGQEARWIWG